MWVVVTAGASRVAEIAANAVGGVADTIVEEHAKWSKMVQDHLTDPPSEEVMKLLNEGGFIDTWKLSPEATVAGAKVNNRRMWVLDRDGKCIVRTYWRLGPVEGLVTAELRHPSDDQKKKLIHVEIDSPSFPTSFRPFVLTGSDTISYGVPGLSIPFGIARAGLFVKFQLNKVVSAPDIGAGTGAGILDNIRDKDTRTFNSYVEGDMFSITACLHLKLESMLLPSAVNNVISSYFTGSIPDPAYELMKFGFEKNTRLFARL